MTPSQAAKLLAKLAATDGRTVSETTARAWAETLHDVGLDEALAAVPVHFRESTAWCMPAHILGIVVEQRRERHRIEREAAEAEATEQAALGRGPTGDRSAAVGDLLAKLAERLGPSDPAVLRRREWVERERRRQRQLHADAAPNPLYRPAPPGGYPVPGDNERQTS